MQTMHTDKLIRSFRFINLIISTIFLGFISLKLGFVISDWLLATPSNITIFMVVIKTILGIMGTVSILFFLSNLNWIVFEASSQKQENNNG